MGAEAVDTVTVSGSTSVAGCTLGLGQGQDSLQPAANSQQPAAWQRYPSPWRTMPNAPPPQLIHSPALPFSPLCLPPAACRRSRPVSGAAFPTTCWMCWTPSKTSQLATSSCMPGPPPKTSCRSDPSVGPAGAARAAGAADAAPAVQHQRYSGTPQGRSCSGMLHQKCAVDVLS